MKLTIREARGLAETAMQACGHDPAEAALIADHLIDCELRGLSYGGLPRALSIVERMRWTTTERRPISVLRESPVSAALDGGDQVGYLVGARALELALEKAAGSGLAVVGAHDTWYTGMLSYYLEQVARAGLVGLAAGSGGNIVAPHGGTQGRFATNPIAFAFPTEDEPIVWDIGTSSITLAEVLLQLRLGGTLPQGSAFDAEGAPTCDPQSALGGALSVWGGHRGSGLAVVVQLLGMLCGAAASPVGLADCGFFLLVVDPALLSDAADFRSRASAYAELLRSTRPVDPDQPVRVPFERSVAERARRQAEDAIEVANEVYEALLALAMTDHTDLPAAR